MSYFVYDIVILAILILFAILGLKRGLVRSLFSLLAVLVALVGALLLANYFAPAVSKWIQPMLQPAISSAVESALPSDAAQIELPADELLLLLEDIDLPSGLDRFLESYAQDNTVSSLGDGLSVHLTENAANAISHIVLFLLAFILILIIWRLLARTLDLVARLPGLNILNRLGGLLFGILRGAILLFLCAWLIRWLWSDLLPAEIIEQSKLLHFFMTTNPVDLLANI